MRGLTASLFRASKWYNIRMRIILASKSPRRKEIMSLITSDFEIISEEVNERAIEARVLIDGGDSVAVQKELARAKASAVFSSLPISERNECIVIGADTSVVCDDKILGKPEDKDDARKMLRMLCGRTHEVITGVCVKSASFEENYAEITRVRFGDLDSFQEELIEKYIDTDEPYDKAGAYGIQGLFGKYIEKIDGDYNNVVGLPVSKIVHTLIKF